jgi:hypothetical protein
MQLLENFWETRSSNPLKKLTVLIIVLIVLLYGCQGCYDYEAHHCKPTGRTDAYSVLWSVHTNVEYLCDDGLKWR